MSNKDDERLRKNCIHFLDCANLKWEDEPLEVFINMEDL